MLSNVSVQALGARRLLVFSAVLVKYFTVFYCPTVTTRHRTQNRTSSTYNQRSYSYYSLLSCCHSCLKGISQSLKYPEKTPYDLHIFLLEVKNQDNAITPLYASCDSLKTLAEAVTPVGTQRAVRPIMPFLPKHRDNCQSTGTIYLSPRQFLVDSCVTVTVFCDNDKPNFQLNF